MKICPKCGYQRKPADNEFISSAECPRCGVVYDKFRGDTVEDIVEVEKTDDSAICPPQETEKQNQSQGGPNADRRKRISRAAILGISLIILIPACWLAVHIYQANNEYSKAYRAMKKVQASLESGVNFQDYSKAVNDAKLEINMISRKTPGMMSLVAIYEWYQLSKEVWKCKLGCSWRNKRCVVKKSILLLDIKPKHDLISSTILFADAVSDSIVDQILRQHGIKSDLESWSKDNLIDETNLSTKERLWLSDLYGDGIMDDINQLIWARASKEIQEYEK